MEKKIARILKDGTLEFPYNDQLRLSIKALDATWKPDKKHWIVPLGKLDEARTLTETAAKENDWLLLDYSTKSVEQITQEQETSRLAERDAHQTAFVDALEGVPPGSLKLEGWENETLHIGITQHLETPIFEALARSSIGNYRRTIMMVGIPKTSWGFKLTALATIPILAALAKAKTQYLEFQMIDEAVTFDNATILHAGDMIGIAVDTVRMDDWEWGADPWPIAAYAGRTYVLSKRDKFLTDRLNAQNLPFRNWTLGTDGIRVAHLQDYFVKWAAEQIEMNHPTVKKYWSARDPHGYDHPADPLFGWKVKLYVQNILGWSDEQYDINKKRVAEMKVAAATAAIDAARSNAKTTALPKLEKMTKVELQALLDKYAVPFKKTAAKADLVHLAGNSQEACEEIVGLRKAK